MPSVFDVVQKVDDENNTVVTRMLVPGLSAEQVDVSVDGSIISVVINVDNEKSEEFVKQIYSERTQRSFQMSTDYDVGQTQVDLTDGVLTLTAPRVIKVDQTVKLPINTKAEKSKPKLGK
jgi:HSP20 family molecular chaperone IbpA